MATADREALSDLTAMAERAQKALEQRPRLSIRIRLTLGAVAWVVLTVGLAVASIVTISTIRDKLEFTVAVDRYTFEIQQARRFEKNYFLYRTNLPDALENVQLAENILESEEEHIRSVIGDTELNRMIDHLVRYHSLLVRLQELDAQAAPPASPEYEVIETGLRENGAEMVAVAEDLVNRERRSVDSMLRISQRIPVGFVVVLLLLLAYLVIFIARQILAPLRRMKRTAERVADGDFTPITPVRKFHDEFSQLSVAMNRMMIQLAHRHDLLVQAHKLKAVGTLTAGVAHELNNPINNIMLTAASLQEDYGDLDEEDRMDMVNDLVGESERAQKIVRNLLDFARESNIETDAIEPLHLVEETLQLATNQIKLAKVKVRGEIDENLPIVHGDFQQLTQVLLNIVLNALDAMPGGGELTISLSAARGGDFVAISFSDTGTGIPDHLLGSIFDPFFTTKSGTKGTGLGLSVSLGIIQQHGGDIHVQSEPGEGTTFTVLLPTAKVPAAIPDVREEEEEEEIPI
jgi:two-component system NtrC family sensor kinase